jgi:hypothetical protein
MFGFCIQSLQCNLYLFFIPLFQVCAYTDLSSDVSRSSTRAPKSLVRVFWNVRDVTNKSTSLPLTFIMAVRQCGAGKSDGEADCSDPSYKWTLLHKPVSSDTDDGDDDD